MTDRIPGHEGAVTGEDAGPPTRTRVGVPARLIRRVRRVPLTLVVAPAGFGKTTLLQAWQASITTESTALVSFDPFQRATATDVGEALLAGIVEVGVEPRAARDLIALIPEDGGSLGVDLIRGVEALLRAVPDPFLLIVDDVHGLSPQTSRDLGRLLSMVADHDHRFVIASRREPAWPIHRWRVAGFADLVAADDLRLTDEEVAGALGPGLAEVAPRVAAMTGGWPAAVETVRWRLRADPAASILDAVLDLTSFVTAEVLPVMHDAELRVLSRTSILEAFPATVATAVSGDVSAPVILDETVRTTSLLTRHGDGRYRYHLVLREALHHRLGVLEPGAEPMLHARAAEAWLGEPDSFTATVNAVDHLLEAREWASALAQIRRRWPSIDVHSRLDRLVGWLDAIPGRWWRDDRDMALLYLWANLRIGRTARALDVLHDTTLRSDPSATAMATVVYASMTGWTTDPREALALARTAMPTLRTIDAASVVTAAPGYPGVTGHALAAEIAVAQAHAMIGDLDAACTELERILEHQSEIMPAMLVTMRGAYAFALAMRGDRLAALEQATRALLLADETESQDHVRTTTALVALAVTDVLAGEHAAAVDRLEAAVRRMRPPRAANLLRMADLAGAMAGVERSYLEDMDPPVSPAPLPFIDLFVTAAAARRQAALGDRAGAIATLRTTSPHELTLSAWVEVLLDGNERRQVARWLRSQPPPGGDHARVIRSLVEAATAERPDAALSLAEAAAATARPQRLLGVLLDAPRQLWARPELARTADPLLLETLERLRARADRPTVTFTARELELLRLLPSTIRVADLADRMFVSVNTAKWHRANIYRKLGVRRRIDAVARAVELGLIEPMYGQARVDRP